MSTHLPHDLIAAPLFIIGALLVLSGVFSLDPGQIAVGAIFVMAGVGLYRKGHYPEGGQSKPFSHRHH